MTSNVAKAHYLYPQKGVIQVGSDADLFIYKKQDTKITKTHSKTNYTLYQDQEVNGEVLTTISRGNFVVKDKTFIENKGKLLNKGGTYESN